MKMVAAKSVDLFIFYSILLKKIDAKELDAWRWHLLDRDHADPLSIQYFMKEWLKKADLAEM